VSRVEWNQEGRDWPNRDHSRFVEAGGLRWHVQVAGSGPILLLLHGTGAATHSWRDLLPLLAKDFTVVAPDLPGHAFTQGRAGKGTLPAMASGVAALLEALALMPELIIGHSAGAAVAVRMVVDGFVSPRKIISVNGALLPFPGIAAKLFPAMAQMLFINPIVPRLFTLQASIPGEVGRFLARSTGSRIDRAGEEFYTRLFRTSDHCAAALGMMANWDLTGLKAGLPALRVPIALVYGEKDAAVPSSVARDVARLVPDSELIAMPGLGHLAPEEDPQGFAEIARSLSRGHETAEKGKFA
jgi:magnesium chelatase accessory protein